MTNTRLSPAAQAVLDAFFANWADDPLYQDRLCLATALRAVADQVVPKTPPLKFGSHYLEGIWDGRDEVRDDLLAIATELEAHQ